VIKNSQYFFLQIAISKQIYHRRKKKKKWIINYYCIFNWLFGYFSLSEQRSYWDNLKMSIETAIKKLNPGNIRSTRTKLIKLNIIRGKGLLCRAIMEAQSNSLHFTHIYATLVSFINHDVNSFYLFVKKQFRPLILMRVVIYI